MYFTHAAPVWEAHPGLRAVAMIIENVRAVESDGERLARLVPRIERRLDAGPESTMPEIAAWRDAFTRMGLKSTQYRSAAEALLRRYRRERHMPPYHPLVDYLNFVSMAYAVPIAAYDCERIARGIVVCPADGSEVYETFQGEIEHPAPGEVVFADAEGCAHSRRWTFRQSARSVVRPPTARVLIVAEALHAGAGSDIGALGDEVRAGLAAAGARVVASMAIGPADRLLEVPSS